MAYKLYAREQFEATDSKGKNWTFTCYTQNTSYGFRHICTLGYNDTANCSYIKKDILAKCCYYNRTWECFRYQTVLREAIEKLATDKQTREELTQILIHKQELDKRAAAKKWVKDFENTYNQLSDKNKEHLKNGLGENLIQTEEQANAVLGVMKMMNAFDSFGL
jgi:hypothetical protein